MGIFDGILDGLGWIWDQTVGQATSAIWDQVVGGLVGWVVDAIAWFVEAVLRFFERSSTPDLASGWFSGGGIGPGSHSPYGVVAGLALSLMLLFVLASTVQGVLAGEGPQLAGRVVRDVAAAVFGIVATIGVVQVLLGATDDLAHTVLEQTQAGHNAKEVMSALTKVGLLEHQASFVVFLLGLVGVVAAFMLWIELLVRASLIYLLIALSPLAYAAFVWPAARRVLKRLAELIVALVMSKVVIAIALAVAASALRRGAASGLPTGEEKIGALLVGVVMFGLGAFAPFVVLKLLPVVEAAVVAQGISRAPLRTAQSGASTSFYIARLAGGPTPLGASSAGGPSAAALSAGGPPGASSSGAGLGGGPVSGAAVSGDAASAPAPAPARVPTAPPSGPRPEASLPPASREPRTSNNPSPSPASPVTPPRSKPTPERDVATTDPAPPT